jgi:predicted  nucleic acid-binding Zn-ribbon protein
MNKKEYNTIWARLEKHTETLNKIDTNVAVVKEHLRTQNNRIEKTENHCKEIDARMATKFQVLHSKTDWIENRIYLAIGGLGVLSLLALTKAIGIW